MGITRLFWLFVGGSSLGLGTLGIFLPLLPTVPFYLLAAFGFSKSSDRIHNWLLNHKVFGPDIRDWNERRVIKRRAKLMALTAMAASLIIAIFLGVPYKYIAIQVVILGLVARFIWRQKES